MRGRDLIAWNLRKLRVAAGISQENLAVDAGLDRTYVFRLERGTDNPTVDVLDKLALSLHVPVAAFLAEPAAGETPPQPLRSGRRPSRATSAAAKP